jgi:hypothetical protein
MKNENKSNASRTLTDSENSSVREHLAAILAIVCSAELGDGALPVELDKLSDQQETALVVRTIERLRDKRNETQRAVYIAAKAKIDAAMHVARLASVEAYREIASLSPTVRAMLGDKANAPTHTSIPVSSVMHAFPEGTQEATALLLLSRMNYKLTPGARKDNSKHLSVHIGSDFLAKTLAAKSETIEETPVSES